MSGARIRLHEMRAGELDREQPTSRFSFEVETTQGVLGPRPEDMTRRLEATDLLDEPRLSAGKIFTAVVARASALCRRLMERAR